MRAARTPQAAPTIPSLDRRIIAHTYLDELSRHLFLYLEKCEFVLLHVFPGAVVLIEMGQAPPNSTSNSRTSTRLKLTRLTRQQFQKLLNGYT
jgi:hypothetical protein